LIGGRTTARGGAKGVRPYALLIRPINLRGHSNFPGTENQDTGGGGGRTARGSMERMVGDVAAGRGEPFRT